MFGGKGVAVRRQEEHSSDPPVATTRCRLLLFSLSLRNFIDWRKISMVTSHMALKLVSITPDVLCIASSMLPLLTRSRRAFSLYQSPTRRIFTNIGSAPALYLLGS
jgi:hypothetical protein